MVEILTSETGQFLGTFTAGLITGLLPLTSSWIRKRQRHRGDNRYFRAISDYDMRVHDLLTELRAAHNAARAMVFQFHNGETFFSGSPIQRVSCTHESVAGGAVSIMPMRSGAPVSLYASVMDRVLRDDPQLYFVADLPEGHCKSQLLNWNVVAFACMPIKQGSHKIIGYVKLHWMYEPVSNENTQAVFRAATQKIESILSQRMLAVGRGHAYKP